MDGLSQYHRNTVPTRAEELQKILNVFKNIAYLAGKSTGELGFEPSILKLALYGIWIGNAHAQSDCDNFALESS
jgi:hypothetical protein